MLAMFLLQVAASDAMASYQQKTRATVSCDQPRDGDVVVCGHREADRYRAPLVEHAAGDPLWEGVMQERVRYLAPTNNCREKSAFLVGCGAVGVSVGTNGVGPMRERPLAP